MSVVAPSHADMLDTLDTLEHAIAVVLPDLRVLHVNRAWQRVLGIPRTQCAGRPLFSCGTHLGDSPAREMIEATSKDGATRRFDIAIGGPGSPLVGVRVARTHDRLLVLEIARAYSTTVSARDAAFEERNEENAALRVLAKKMAEVADSAQLLDILCEAASAQCDATGGAVIHMGDMQGDIVAATGSMAVARGRRFPLAGSLAGEAISSRAAVSVDDFGRSDRPLARTMPELAVGPLLVAPLYAHDTAIGAIAVVRAENAVAFSAREAQRLHVIADHASLALWKAELLEQAQAADQAKGRFLATISHELRTPLTALSGYEELLVDQVLGPLHESQRDVLERMRSITQHLAALIEEVLAFSSLEAGRESVRPTEFLAADLLRSAAAIIEPLVRQKHLQLHVDAPDDPIRITSDIDKLRQILVNLAGNAVKFTDTGHVRFAVRRAGPEIRFAVEDTGIGIAPADAHRLFRPFMQLDTGLTRRHGGTGLGLYISQRLARLLDGRIELQSTPGQGSTFALLVPA